MSKEEQTINNHIEIIVGTFVVGTLAVIVASAWNDFSKEILLKLEQVEGVKGISQTFLFFKGMYVLIVTIVAVLVMYILVRFEIVRHRK